MANLGGFYTIRKRRTHLKRSDKTKDRNSEHLGMAKCGKANEYGKLMVDRTSK